MAYGTNGRRRNTELAIWARRLAYELGAFELAKVSLSQLPEYAPPNLCRARQGFALLAGLRWAVYDQEPIPFTRSFLGPWCGLSERQARDAIDLLRKLRMIVPVGHAPPKGGRQAILYEPGPDGIPVEHATPENAWAWGNGVPDAFAFDPATEDWEAGS